MPPIRFFQSQTAEGYYERTVSLFPTGTWVDVPPDADRARWWGGACDAFVKRLPADKAPSAAPYREAISELLREWAQKQPSQPRSVLAGSLLNNFLRLADGVGRDEFGKSEAGRTFERASSSLMKACCAGLEMAKRRTAGINADYRSVVSSLRLTEATERLRGFVGDPPPLFQNLTNELGDQYLRAILPSLKDGSSDGLRLAAQIEQQLGLNKGPDKLDHLTSSVQELTKALIAAATAHKEDVVKDLVTRSMLVVEAVRPDCEALTGRGFVERKPPTPGQLRDLSEHAKRAAEDAKQKIDREVKRDPEKKDKR